MALFQNNNLKEEKHAGVLGVFSVDNIKWEPESDLDASIIAKRYPYEDFPNGSYLHVAPSQVAVFTNNMAAGESSEGTSQNSQVAIFVGPCKVKLDTGDSRFAPFRNISHALTGGSSAFHSVVYFINTTYMNELKWGTSDPIIVSDPEEEVNVHVRAYGLFGVHIEQSDPTTAPIQARKFLTKIVGTRGEYTREQLTSFLRAKILEYVPDLLAKQMIEKNIGILKISAHISEYSEVIKSKLTEHFNEFGLSLDNFSFNSIKPSEEDLAAVNEMKILRKSRMLEAEGNAAGMDIESSAIARKRQREGYNYQQERSMDVMHAAASNEGTSSSFMGAGMGIGMGFGVGGAIGSNIANMANESINPQTDASVSCPVCHTMNPRLAKFCQSCGTKLSSGIVCENCGANNPLGAKFCVECGTPIKLVRKCKNCGEVLDSNGKFCPSCGNKVE